MLFCLFLSPWISGRAVRRLFCWVFEWNYFDPFGLSNGVLSAFRAGYFLGVPNRIFLGFQTEIRQTQTKNNSIGKLKKIRMKDFRTELLGHPNVVLLSLWMKFLWSSKQILFGLWAILVIRTEFFPASEWNTFGASDCHFLDFWMECFFLFLCKRRGFQTESF